MQQKTISKQKLSKELQEKQARVLKELLKLQDNLACLDCSFLINKMPFTKYKKKRLMLKKQFIKLKGGIK